MGEKKGRVWGGGGTRAVYYHTGKTTKPAEPQKRFTIRKLNFMEEKQGLAQRKKKTKEGAEMLHERE